MHNSSSRPRRRARRTAAVLVRGLQSVALTTLAALAALAMPAPSVVVDPLLRPASLRDAASDSVLLGLARAGERVVAVGERGTILLSDDQGQHWRQAAAPVNVTLTAVHFADAHRGWAVGHGQVVLRTDDGGVNWVRQLDGRQVAQIERQAVQADPDATDAERKAAQRLVDDGPDKPFLAVHFLDRDNGLVVGAYGSILATSDGGKSWRSRRADLSNPAGRHLYGIHVRGSEVYLAGEQGMLFRAASFTAPFEALKTPYRGTFFGATHTANGDLLAYGLRGNLWRLAAGSSTWIQVLTPGASTFTAATLQQDGNPVLVDENSKLLRSPDGGRHFVAETLPHATSFTSVVQTSDGSLVLATARGALRVAPPAAQLGSSKP